MATWPSEEGAERRPEEAAGRGPAAELLHGKREGTGANVPEAPRSAAERLNQPQDPERQHRMLDRHRRHVRIRAGADH